MKARVRLAGRELRRQVPALLDGDIGPHDLEAPLTGLRNLGFIDDRGSIARLLAEA